MSDQNYTAEEQAKFEAKLEPESRPLFTAVLNLTKPGFDSCVQFELFIKQRYGKEKPITPRFLNLWAGKYGTIKPLPKWLLSAAIDFLNVHYSDPTQIIPIEKVAEHWARPRVTQMIQEEAKQAFIKLFSPQSSQLAAIYQAIEHVYAKPLPPN